MTVVWKRGPSQGWKYSLSTSHGRYRKLFQIFVCTPCACLALITDFLIFLDWPTLNLALFRGVPNINLGRHLRVNMLLQNKKYNHSPHYGSQKIDLHLRLYHLEEHIKTDLNGNNCCTIFWWPEGYVTWRHAILETL